MFIKNFWQKHYRKIVPFLILGLIVLAGHFIFSKTKAPKEPSAFKEKALGSQNSSTEQNKTLKEQVGQMLILGFRGTQFETNSFIDKAINELKIGGVILFDYDVPSSIFPRNILNPEQVKKLTTDLQKNSVTPLFISIDIEGGLVNRLKPKYGFMEIPSAKEMGQGSPENTFQIAKKLGEQLKNLGINFDFAPVVDLSPLGRSFSSDPQIVITHAENFINGLSENKIITSLKHFPGHGSSKTDSHQGLTDITQTYQAQELIPFQELIKKNIVPTVMIGHLFNKNLDQEYPATLSSNTIQKTLKDLVGFNGVVICDDLSMGAISQNYGLAEAAIKMIQAGCDLIIISNNVGSYDETLPYQVSNAILQAVSTGVISTTSIEASYNKIIKLKNDFGIIK